ncbi:putative DNA-binding protein [Bradyrhizobium macuxiense]|uniref:Putative DNA-binding protein n=1 Tax=Bradyrhizobium macuxiense TaxID=1755647 RepID=A0A560L1E7_9BRAD|nr:ATP-binding protein [Bradyrhizobium macuxiense]TWB89293.1 putative DNA-binding protein [Bradyrhizobium macuxiense]
MYFERRTLSILRKSLTEISIADLDALIASEARETGELEFKGSLPFVPTKGQPAAADRWIEKGDRLGDYARDQLLAEVVAFANADGGTLIVGIHETKDEPRRAESLEALPNCEGLTRRLLDAAEDVIEPRLPTINARAISVSKDGSGYVVLRVGKSLAGPHRLTTTREFYVRRGERAARMTVREIKDHTLETLRFADRLEVAFAERRTNASAEYQRLLRTAQGTPIGIPPLVLRVTAAPTTPQTVPDLTRRHPLWWKGRGFRLKVDQGEVDCGFPLRQCGGEPRVRLRSLVADIDPNYDYISRLLRSDGVVEFLMCEHRQDAYQGSTAARIYVGWLVGLTVGAICQVDHLRKHLAWDAVEYGLEIEVWTAAPLSVFWGDREYRGAVVKDELPLTLPRYSLASDTPRDELLTMIVRDLYDACGSTWNQRCEAPWDNLQN